MRVGHFNVRGLKTRAVLVREFMLKENLDVLVLVETFVSKGSIFEVECQIAAVCNDPRTESARAAGGTAVLNKPGLHYKVIRKAIFASTELVAVQVEGSLIGGVYIPPIAPWRGVEQALETFRSLLNGKALLIGNLNARHRDWCVKDNRRGEWLRQWAIDHRWEIHAPPQTTCRSSNGAQSIIDFTLIKSGTLRRLSARLEWI